jgi:phage major head subunit gpT-like protein
MATPLNYAAFITTVDTTIGAIYSELDPLSNYKEFATVKSMSGSIWEAGWSQRIPKARAWFGSRVTHEPAIITYSVAPIPYELTVGIDRFTLDDSNVNTESPFWRTLPDIAMQWRRQPDYELRDLLEGSGVQTTDGRQNGLDGLSAFNTAHPINIYNPGFNGGGNPLFTSGTYCNDFTSGGQTINGTLIGGALSTTAFASVLQYMQMIPDEAGEALGVMPNMLMVPSTLQVEAQFIVNSAFLASPTWGAFSPLTGQVGTADNMLRKMGVRVMVNPWLKNTKRWYMMDTAQSLKPLLWIVREAPRTVPRVNENDPIVFDSHRYTWGGWDRVTPAWNYSFLFARSGP